MSEKELNSYRFLSGEDPTDEMLAQIMKEAAKEARMRKREADVRAMEEMSKMRKALWAEYSEKISRLINGR